MFDLYGIVDILPDWLFVLTITLYGCMYRHSCYIHFSSKEWMARHSKTCALAASLEETPPYSSPHWGPPVPWTFSDNWTAWGIPQTKTLSSKNWEAYNLGVRSTFPTKFNCTQQLRNKAQTGFLNSPGELCWLDLTIWIYHQLLGLVALQRSFNAGKLRILLVDHTVR